MSLERSVLWRNLDTEGMDACQFESGSDGWRISGTALFVENGSVARLAYEVTCGSDWRTRTAAVSGWIGRKRLALSLQKTDTAGWSSDGAPLPGTRDLLDVDFGFTPATNTNAIRRLGLQPGEEAEIATLWLDTSDWQLKPLPQVYRRRSGTVVAYASPLHDFHADLTVDSFGVIENYPELWTAARIDAHENGL